MKTLATLILVYCDFHMWTHKLPASESMASPCIAYSTSGLSCGIMIPGSMRRLIGGTGCIDQHSEHIATSFVIWTCKTVCLELS
ncbi:hypothetical protein NEOLEDRAFT_1128690 [Neolentinus lepideus HHB14362 ss-1]|uniref:Uncharacterized protein n=1 Tax=Neolentinus lepideus HHB14362 ss-1 TaxID=1314782 RepID=A0A165V3V7_9AGAM|nr:hypothetical protein NEOLEDRAFT_1128690 [Neolentinus lepideus HHB14362 ss-1]